MMTKNKDEEILVVSVFAVGLWLMLLWLSHKKDK